MESGTINLDLIPTSKARKKVSHKAKGYKTDSGQRKAGGYKNNSGQHKAEEYENVGMNQKKKKYAEKKSRYRDRVPSEESMHQTDAVHATYSRQAKIEMQRMQRMRRVKHQRRVFFTTLCFIGITLILLIVVKHKMSNKVFGEKDSIQTFSEKGLADLFATEKVQGIPEKKYLLHPDWEEDFLTPNEYSRPQEKLPEVKNVFVHYTANPGTSAAQNRSYFEQQKDMHQASVSAHFIIGYDGEIIQCVPLDEIAYAVQTRNYDSISIECCFKAKNGQFTQETYDSLIDLLAWLLDVYQLDTDDILRHYDCGGKKCPLYYTEHPDAWKLLKSDVADKKAKNY